MIRVLILAATCCATTTPAQANDLTAVTFVCERGVEVPVVFVNSKGGGSHAVAWIDGRLLGMRQVISASGARFRSGNGADAYQLWNKGGSAVVSVGPEGADRILFSDCSARR